METKNYQSRLWATWFAELLSEPSGRPGQSEIGHGETERSASRSLGLDGAKQKFEPNI